MKLNRFAVLAVALIALTGCAGDVAFVEAADRYHKSVGEDYAAYVAADLEAKKIDAFQAKIRLDAHRRFGENIESHKKLGGVR